MVRRIVKPQELGSASREPADASRNLVAHPALPADDAQLGIRLSNPNLLHRVEERAMILPRLKRADAQQRSRAGGFKESPNVSSYRKPRTDRLEIRSQWKSLKGVGSKITGGCLPADVPFDF